MTNQIANLERRRFDQSDCVQRRLRCRDCLFKPIIFRICFGKLQVKTRYSSNIVFLFYIHVRSLSYIFTDNIRQASCLISIKGHRRSSQEMIKNDSTFRPPLGKRSWNQSPFSTPASPPSTLRALCSFCLFLV